jgi:hypothetical protein
MDRVAAKEGYVFLGHAKDWSGVESKVYRMWKMSDRRKQMRIEKKRKLKKLKRKGK